MSQDDSKSAPERAGLVAAEFVCAQYRNLPAAVAVNAIISGLLCVALHDTASTARLTWWLIAVYILATTRYVVWVLFEPGTSGASRFRRHGLSDSERAAYLGAIFRRRRLGTCDAGSDAVLVRCSGYAFLRTRFLGRSSVPSPQGGENGIEVVARLREEFNAQVPALLVTGDTGIEQLREAEESGLHVLHKPLNPSRLRSLIANLRRQSPRVA